MSASAFVTSAAFAFILFTSCKKELAGIQGLQTGPEQKKSAKKQAIAVGSYYGGGIVFHLDETGEHGLIVSTENAGLATWGCMGTVVTGTVPFLDAGQQNTAAILEGCSEPGIAARLADSWIGRQKNDPLKHLQNEKETPGDDQGKKYDDWYLPSFVEAFLFLDAIGRLRANDASLYPLFPDGDYWTSTQGDNNFMNTIGDGATTAFLLNFTTIPVGEPSFTTFRLNVEFAQKDLVAHVRAIRAF